MGEHRVDTSPRKLPAFVICLNNRCRYYADFLDIRESPKVCPRCGGPLVRECGTCQMLLRSSSSLCSNCGRPIAASVPREPEGRRS